MIFDLLYRTLNLNFLLLFFAAKIRDTHAAVYYHDVQCWAPYDWHGLNWEIEYLTTFGIEEHRRKSVDFHLSY